MVLIAALSRRVLNARLGGNDGEEYAVMTALRTTLPDQDFVTVTDVTCYVLLPVADVCLSSAPRATLPDPSSWRTNHLTAS